MENEAITTVQEQFDPDQCLNLAHSCFAQSRFEEALYYYKLLLKNEPENADYYFNSALVYELAAIRAKVEPALAAVPADTPEHAEAARMLEILRYVSPMDPDLVPSNSILQEFLGKSLFQK